MDRLRGREKGEREGEREGGKRKGCQVYLDIKNRYTEFSIVMKSLGEKNKHMTGRDVM